MALYGQSKAIERKGISWIKQCSMLEYNNDIKGFSIVISAILSWQYPGSIGQHRETLQTIFRLYPITSVFNISIHSILVTQKHEYLLQNQICSDVFFLFKFMSKALAWGDMMWNQLIMIKIRLESFWSSGSFYPSCLGVSEGCLGGVWRLSEWLWIQSGGGGPGGASYW